MAVDISLNTTLKLDRAEQIDPNSKHFYYSKLFRVYNRIPLEELLTSFTKVYNDLMGKEKPQTYLKYFPTEVRIMELVSD